MNKIDNIYKTNSKNISQNNKKYCYVKEGNIEDKINELFQNRNLLYHNKMIIKTKEKEYKTYIIDKTEKEIITVDSNRIPINKIVEIEKEYP